MIGLPVQAYIATNFFAKINCDPGWKWTEREQPMDNYDLFYVWDGAGELQLNGKSFPLRKGSCFLFRPGDMTSAVHDSQRPLTLTYIHFNVASEPAHIPEPFRQIDEPTELETLLSRYVRLRLSSLYGAAEEAALVLKQMMIVLLRLDRLERESHGESSAALRDRIVETANYVREHPSSWFTVAELANRAGLSPRYFSAKFKQYVGSTVQHFSVNSRLERAAFLLHYGGLTVSETADALGYKDVYFFSKQFKARFGKNPSSFR